MQTTLRIAGANCSICFNEALDGLGRIDGVSAVHGSIGESCIEIDHDDAALDVITATIRDHLHGIEMFSNEIRMVPLEPVALSAPCIHQRVAHQAACDTPPARSDMNTINPSMTLGEIVTLHPSLATDLERRGLDYCCHGARTLAAAAVEIGADPQAVADELSAVRVDEPAAAWASLGPADLVDHIESVHHRYLWSELSRISALVDKIVNVHGDRHHELAEVQRLFAELRADFEPHLIREEQVLFPMIRHLSAPADQSSPDIEQLAEQIEVLASEHETVGALLEELRRVTGGFVTPADGCASYAACYRALADLEADTHLHVHKENNVLFPAARALLVERLAASVGAVQR
ncbi:MAG: iron-sulfur cluster repair di-iron protein [Ilumatobacteraceae bacterium]|jgi:regulator of cell morphogenesis and NO signaling|nr:iron-sulfur cluster repair di-iron protein [Ilumatobacteraceae bacterium]